MGQLTVIASGKSAWKSRVGGIFYFYCISLNYIDVYLPLYSFIKTTIKR